MTSPFLTHNPLFLDLLAENTSYRFAHEAGIYIASKNELFITSNRIKETPTSKPRIQITKVNLDNTRTASNPTATCHELSSPIPMANGGVNYRDGMLFCGQGSMDQPGGIYFMSSEPPYTTSLLVGDFYSRPFNSVNDVVVHSDGAIWFTDPIHGFEQGYRPAPCLPAQVYRFCPWVGSVRAMADGFGRPNGICFSPDEKVVYVTDTDREHGDGNVDDMRASSIYAFDVSVYHGQPFLTNRRLFAMTDAGIPDGIKCDLAGYVYSGCGDGVHVWSPGGVLLGRILVDGGAANFCFGRDGEMFILNENRLWRARLQGGVNGAFLGI